jgi:hypothetical protein
VRSGAWGRFFREIVRVGDASGPHAPLVKDADTGKAPRPATEPRGAEGSSDSPKTRTDPGSGET